MRKWITGIAAALLVAGWVWAQTAYNAPGGLPSRPTFQQVTTSHAWATDNGAVAAIVSGIPMVTLRDTSQAANARNWRAYLIGTTFKLDSSNDAQNVNSVVLAATRAAGSASLSEIDIGNSTDNPAVTINGVTAPSRYAAGVLSITASSCGIAGFVNINLASCTRNSAGNYTVAFTSGFHTQPACVFTPSGTGTTQLIATTGGSGGASIIVATVAPTTGTSTDWTGNLQMICVGT